MDEPDMVYHLTDYRLYHQMVLTAVKFDQAVKTILKPSISVKTAYQYQNHFCWSNMDEPDMGNH